MSTTVNNLCSPGIPSFQCNGAINKWFQQNGYKATETSLNQILTGANQPSLIQATVYTKQNGNNIYVKTASGIYSTEFSKVRAAGSLPVILKEVQFNSPGQFEYKSKGIPLTIETQSLWKIIKPDCQPGLLCNHTESDAFERAA